MYFYFRYQSSNLFDPRHLDLQSALKLDTHFNSNVDFLKNHDKNEFYDNYRYVETQLPSKQNSYKNSGRSQVVEVKARISVDVSTMTDPLTIEEQERLGQWEGFAAIQSGNKVAEYLTSLREFLKVIKLKFCIVIIRKTQMSFSNLMSFNVY